MMTRTTMTSSRSTSKSTKRSTNNTTGNTASSKGASAARAIPRARALRGISDKALLSGIRRLSETERKTVLSILVHLVEIDRRRLYLPLGYSSLYEFCVKQLGYCEATAVRRVNVARCIAQFPLAYRALASGKVSLSNLSMVTRIITAENVSDLLSRIEGAAKKEVELLVSSRNPRSAIRDSVRPVHVRTVLEVPASGDGKEFTITGDGNNPATSSGSGPAGATESGRGPAATERRIVIEERLKISFGADQEFIEKLERIRSLFSTKYHRKLEFEEFFSILMDEYIERHSPEGRLSRKEKREQNKAPQAQKKAGQRHEQKKTVSRYIPRKVRDEVHRQDKGRCTYVSPGGRRCGSKWDLHIDHIVPFARGGDNSPSNLRLLCAKHNRLEAERAYGKKHMEQYVKENTGHYLYPCGNP